jgi:hypothetical protein
MAGYGRSSSRDESGGLPFEDFGKNFTSRVSLSSASPVRQQAEPTMSAIGFGGDGSRRLKRARLCRIFLRSRVFANATK